MAGKNRSRWQKAARAFRDIEEADRARFPGRLHPLPPAKGGHDLREVDDWPDQRWECRFGCGAWETENTAEQCSSGAPEGIDQRGICPKNFQFLLAQGLTPRPMPKSRAEGGHRWCITALSDIVYFCSECRNFYPMYVLQKPFEEVGGVAADSLCPSAPKPRHPRKDRSAARH